MPHGPSKKQKQKTNRAHFKTRCLTAREINFSLRSREQNVLAAIRHSISRHIFTISTASHIQYSPFAMSGHHLAAHKVVISRNFKSSKVFFTYSHPEHKQSNVILFFLLLLSVNIYYYFCLVDHRSTGLRTPEIEFIYFGRGVFWRVWELLPTVVSVLFSFIIFFSFLSYSFLLYYYYYYYYYSFFSSNSSMSNM